MNAWTTDLRGWAIDEATRRYFRRHPVIFLAVARGHDEPWSCDFEGIRSEYREIMYKIERGRENPLSSVQ